MAQNVTLWGASYSNVPAIDVPATGGGTATFYDDTGTQTVTSNGTYDVTGLAEMVVNVSGGAGNYVTGTFTGTTTGAVMNVTIPYTGSGYPIAAMIYVTGGAYNSSVTEWYDLVQRYAVGQWTMSKSNQTTTPTYGGSGATNYGVVTSIYKNSTSSATGYTRTSSMSAMACGSSNPTANATGCARFSSATNLRVFIAEASYGFAANVSYTYHIIYSS